MLMTYAFNSGCIYLDYFSSMADDRNGLPKNLAEDGVHPTKEGYAIMRTLVIDALDSLLEM